MIALRLDKDHYHIPGGFKDQLAVISAVGKLASVFDVDLTGAIIGCSNASEIGRISHTFARRLNLS